MIFYLSLTAGPVAGRAGFIVTHLMGTDKEREAQEMTGLKFPSQKGLK